MNLGTGSQTEASDFKVGDWWVRPQTHTLERADEIRNLEARSMAVLICLGKYAPGVVTKDRLLKEVWDGAFVGEDVIAHAVWELRKAFGDSARQPAYIQTVPRKGYRLIAEVLRPQGSPLPLDGARIDHYDLGEELGRGSMGVVFRAADRRLGRTVAIKFLAAQLTQDAKACRRFEREARLAASLEHPNLATVLEVGETSQGFRYLVSSFYRGGSLKDRLAKGPLTTDEAVRFARQLINGLGAAHSREIIHRDIKPANLLLDEHGTLKICDFGIAKLLGATDLTSTGATLGTPAYKSPEQAAGSAVDHRTDLWAAAVVLYELLTGSRPFTGEGEHAVVHSILSDDPKQVQIPALLRCFMERALAKDPEERFQSAGEMVAALDEAMHTAPTVAHRSPFTSRHRWMGAAIGVALVLAIWLSGQWLGQTDPAPVLTSASNPEGELYLDQAKTLWLRGHHKSHEVEEHLRKAVKLMPSSPEAVGHLAYFLAERFALGNHSDDQTESLTLVSRTLALDARSSLARAAKALILLMAKDPSGTGKNLLEAENLTREAIELHPTCGRHASCELGYLVLADILYQQDKGDEAIETLTTGSTQGDGAIRCKLRLAQLYEKLKQPRKMEDAYIEVLNLDEDQAVALAGLTAYYLQAERFIDAAPLLDHLHRVRNDPRTLLLIGYVQYQNGLWHEAIQTYERADQAFQTLEKVRFPTPLMAIGDVYLEQGKKELAQKAYSEALEIFNLEQRPGIKRLGQRAVCLAKLDRFAEAVPAIESLLENPDHQNIKELWVHAARIYALKADKAKLFAAAAEWIRRDGPPGRLIDEDPAFIPYRNDREYLRILKPGLILPE